MSDFPIVDLTDEPNSTNSPTSSVSESNSVSAGSSRPDIRFPFDDVITIDDSDSSDDDVMLNFEIVEAKVKTESRCIRSAPPPKCARIEIANSDDDDVISGGKVTIVNDVSQSLKYKFYSL